VSEARFERFLMRRYQRGFRTGRVLPPLLLTMVLVVLAFAGVMRLVDSNEYPTYGRAVWFAVQTVTTVGYGDVTPKEPWGRFVAGILMLFGFAFLSLITGTIASALVARATASSRDDLAGLERRIAELEGRADTPR
jgi:voltage-gated potassium channel